MKTAADIVMGLTRIRNCYTRIRMLSLDCLSQNDPDSIPSLLQNREDILELIASEESKIKNSTVPQEAFLALRSEITSIISSIVIIDQQLGTFMRGKLNCLSAEMTKLYSKSRAASAYTQHSMA